MSGALATRAEVVKLARALGSDPSELEFLESVSAEDVRRLREQVVEMLFASDERTFKRLAASSRLLPTGVIAVIAQRAFGPVFAARLAGMIEPARAVEVAAKLPTSFLADVAVHLDPRRAKDVVAKIPAERVGEISRELMARKEYVTMGRFVGHIPDQAIATSLAVIDPETLLRVGFVLEDKDRLDPLVGLLPEGMVDGMVDAAAAFRLWPELLDLISHVSDGTRGKLIRSASIELDKTAVDDLLSAVAEDDLWDQALEMAEHMSDHERQTFAARLDAHANKLDPARREAVLERARALDPSRKA